MDKTPEEPKETAATTEDSNEELLYHYTDQAGLDGILSSGCMWATHYKFLNDFSEREHGFSIFSKAIQEIVRENSFGISPVNLENFGQALLQTLHNYYEITSNFVISFTTDSEREINEHKSGSDRLSQWRGYASGRQGYCLVFNYEAIAHIGNNLHKLIKLSGWLALCFYGEEEKIRIAKETVLPVFNAYRTSIKKSLHLHTSIQPFKDVKGKETEAFKKINTSAIFHYSIMKDASFDEETETRLSVTLIKDLSDINLIRFRDGKSGKVPYIEIPIGIRRPDPTLIKIIVGPSEQKDQQAEVLRLRLQQMGLSQIEVVPSKIPYRNW